MADYEFKYAPLTGRLTGNQMIEQTEQAINGLASLVDEAAGQVTIISTLANEANENAATALETAEEALATTGRTYITVSTQANANDYYDSQLIYIADSTSTNIPVADTGMLEVKTNDNKTACEQVFIADSSGACYFRNGAITAETVGDVTTYTVTWGGWSSEPASQAYVQNELSGYTPLTALAGYLPLSGGTMTGSISFNATNPALVGANTTGRMGLFAGSNNFDGAGLQCFGRNDSTYAGTFYLRASTKSSASSAGDVVDLVGKPNGALTWNGNNVITSAGGTMSGTLISTALPAIKSPANDDQITIAGGSGTASTDGAKIILNGGTRSTNSGEFTVQAGNSNNYKQLKGTPAGSLTWGNSNVAVIGTLQGGHGIITGYKDSISVNANSYSQGTINFGQTFSSAPMVVVCCGIGHAHIHASCSNITTTGFTYTVSSEGPAFNNERINWIAVG